MPDRFTLTDPAGRIVEHGEDLEAAMRAAMLQPGDPVMVRGSTGGRAYGFCFWHNVGDGSPVGFCCLPAARDVATDAARVHEVAHKLGVPYLVFRGRRYVAVDPPK